MPPELSEQVRKCTEENQKKLKLAKNLEDLVKIKLSTISVSDTDKNLDWRQVVNDERKIEEDAKIFQAPHLNKDNDNNKTDSQTDIKQFKLKKDRSSIISNFENLKDNMLNGDLHKFDQDVDPIVHLKNYFKTKEFVPPKKKLRPAKKIVFKDKNADLMNMMSDSFHANNNSGTDQFDLNLKYVNL